MVSEDGSPHGPKTFVLWNPPRLQAGRRASGTGGHGDPALCHAPLSVVQGLWLLCTCPAQVAQQPLSVYARRLKLGRQHRPASTFTGAEQFNAAVLGAISATA